MSEEEKKIYIYVYILLLADKIKEIEIRCLDYIHNVAKRENQRKNQNQALKQNGDVQNWHLDFQVLGPKSAVVCYRLFNQFITDKIFLTLALNHSSF